MNCVVGLYVGGDLPPNLVQLLGSLDEVLHDRFDFEVVGRNLDPEPLPDRFGYANVDNPSPARGLDEMRLAYRDLRRYLDASNPAAVWQITCPHFHALPAVVASRRAGVPVATRIPGQKFDEYRAASGVTSRAKLFALNNVLLRSVRFSSAVVALSENNRENLRRRGVPDERISVLRPPVDTDEFAPVDDDRRAAIRRDVGVPLDATVVLYVGRLSREKGMDTLLSAVDELQTAGVEFHFVGEGEYASDLDAYENTVLHGYVAPDEVHRYYQVADAYVHPSYTEEEGISWTMLEAAAVDLPVVARDVENAAAVASFVFESDRELVDHLRTPGQWSPATYPTEWSLRALEEPYNRFVVDLVGSGRTSG